MTTIDQLMREVEAYRPCWSESIEIPDAVRRILDPSEPSDFAGWVDADVASIGAAPAVPGVYAFFADGECIRVGSSKTLTSRLKSYTLEPSSVGFVLTDWGPVRGFSARYTCCATYPESLTLEFELICRHKPVFNDQHVDRRCRGGTKLARLRFFERQAMGLERRLHRPREITMRQFPLFNQREHDN